jgi:hypothetical protein
MYGGGVLAPTEEFIVFLWMPPTFSMEAEKIIIFFQIMSM